ncbi:MAG: hypothetical protein ABF290_06655 [Thiogranum sp.]
MSTLPPLDVKVNTRRWSCVLDIGLALSPWGLMFAWRLADEMNVWLVPSLWDVLDGADYYLCHPQALAPESQIDNSCEADAQRHLIVETLSQWQTARLEADLPSIPIYWAGDASHDSLLPKDVGPDVIKRFTLLAEALDRRLQLSDKALEPGHPFLDCTRDAVALAAALGRYRPLIFTLGGEAEDGGAPNVCQYLDACGIACRKAPWPTNNNPMQHHLLPALMRSGVAELVWTGMPLVAVHIVAPRAFFMSESEEHAPSYSDALGLEGSSTPRGDWWDRAVGLWYPLT